MISLRSLFSCIFVCLIATMNAQSISGTVKSGADGSSLPGVSIVVKGTSTGTISDLDGSLLFRQHHRAL